MFDGSRSVCEQMILVHSSSERRLWRMWTKCVGSSEGISRCVNVVGVGVDMMFSLEGKESRCAGFGILGGSTKRPLAGIQVDGKDDL